MIIGRWKSSKHQKETKKKMGQSPMLLIELIVLKNLADKSREWIVVYVVFGKILEYSLEDFGTFFCCSY